MVSSGRSSTVEGWDRPWKHDPLLTEQKRIESVEKVAYAEAKGRFPANVIHDGNHHPFPYTTSGIPSGNRNAAPGYEGGWGSGTPVTGFGDSGSAGRFFHVAKTEEELIAYLTLMVE
jgi:hypothetical protein